MGDASATVSRMIWVYRTAAWALLSLAVAFAGPYNDVMSYDFMQRLGYWSSVNALAIIVAAFIRAVILKRFPGETMGLLLGVACAQALVLGPMIWTLNTHVFGFETEGLGWLAELTLIMLLIALCVALVRYEVARARRQAQAQAQAQALAGAQGEAQLALGAEQDVAERPRRPGFLDRADPDLPGEVLVVSAADHYLDVITTEGRGRVLMRFRDAMIELDSVPGYRIHRSHWVAVSELVRVRLDGRRHLADLKSGNSLPISDAYVDELRRAGLMDDDASGRRIGDGPKTNMSASGDTSRSNSGRSQNNPPV